MAAPNLSLCGSWKGIGSREKISRLDCHKYTEPLEDVKLCFLYQVTESYSMVGRRDAFSLPFTPSAVQVALVVKNLSANAGDTRDWIRSLGPEGPLEKGMAIHSSVLAWKISWTEEPGGLQFVGPQESDTTEHTPTHCTPNSSITNSRIFVLTCLPLRLDNLFFSQCFPWGNWWGAGEVWSSSSFRVNTL